jgi:hypothetical protein
MSIMNQVEEHKHEGRGHEKQFEIIVNGRKQLVDDRELSFREVVTIAFPNPVFDDNTIYTVDYKRGPDHHPQGSLTEGQSVKVKKGMILNVARSNKS